jgi:hypothetical protein
MCPAYYLTTLFPVVTNITAEKRVGCFDGGVYIYRKINFPRHSFKTINPRFVLNN